MTKLKPLSSLLPLAALSILLPGCASVQPAPQVVACPVIPPLPQEARQPKAPDSCLPTCSDGWARLEDSLLPTPTKPGLRVTPASAGSIK